MFDRATTRPEADAFTSTQLMSIAAQLCDALECMHTLSPPLGPIAHRDVKLDNVLLESSPETEGGLKARSIPYTGPHTTASALSTPILKDFISRRLSPPTPRFQSRHASTPFNSSI